MYPNIWLFSLNWSIVLFEFWQRDLTFVCSTGWMQCSITFRVVIRSVWLNVIICWRTMMVWRDWPTPYQKTINCYQWVLSLFFSLLLSNSFKTDQEVMFGSGCLNGLDCALLCVCRTLVRCLVPWECVSRPSVHFWNVISPKQLWMPVCI